MTATEPVWGNDLLNFRRYWTKGGLVSEGTRRGMDPPSGQMKELYEFMARAVPDGGNEIEVVMTVRLIEE